MPDIKIINYVTHVNKRSTILITSVSVTWFGLVMALYQYLMQFWMLAFIK